MNMATNTPINEPLIVVRDFLTPEEETELEEGFFETGSEVFGWNPFDPFGDKAAATPLEEVNIHEMLDTLKTVLCTLTDRERAVLDYRFGLTEGESKSLVEVGKKFCVSRERIRQIEAKALRKLRNPVRMDRLDGFLPLAV